MRFFFFFCFIFLFSSELSAQKIFSPTALDIFKYVEQGNYAFLQPASSGRIESAMFGMVRNGGTRFHEGIDVKSVKKMTNGTPMDLIRAVYDGKIAHISPENNGSYGRYVVLLHEKEGIELYSLYAHLLSISPALQEGNMVRAGTILGMLGQTSTVYSISKSSAHLHFEIGLALGSEGFDSWFYRNYGGGNLHGHYNGFNLVGADPIGFYSFHYGKDGLFPVQWLKSQKIAFTLRYPVNVFPELLKRSPALLKGKLSAGDFCWEIDFTWFGLPLEFRPVKLSISTPEISVKNAELCRLAEKRSVLAGSEEHYLPGKTLINYLEILFNFPIN